MSQQALQAKQQALQAKQQALQKRAENNYTLFQPYLHSLGSLKHEELSEITLASTLSLSNVSNYSGLAKLLPPIKEGCLDSDEHACIENTLKATFNNAYKQTLLLHKYSRAIRYGLVVSYMDTAGVSQLLWRKLYFLIVEIKAQAPTLHDVLNLPCC